MPGAPGRDIATHGASADDMNALALPLAIRQVFELLAQEENPDQVLRRWRGEQTYERGNFGLLHCRRVATIGFPQIDKRIWRRIILGRRLLFGLASHAFSEQF